MLSKQEKNIMSIKRRKGFGPDNEKQEINLEKYEERGWSPEEIQSHTKRGTFIRFAFLDLDKFGGDIYHEELINIAIRAAGNRDRADEDIARSFKTKGWSYDPFPPIVDTNWKVKDGRTRIRAAILAGEKFIPAAIFAYPDEEDVKTAYVQSLSEGLIGNDDLISHPTKSEDLIEAGISAIVDGNVQHDKTAIASLLFNEFEAERFVKQEEIPDLVEQIFEAVAGGQQAIWIPGRSEVVTYLKKCPDIPKDACLDGEVCLNGKKVFVYAAPSNTNQGRLWGQIAKQIPEESYIVFYTTKKIPSKIKKGYSDFISFIDMRYEECFEIVNRTASQSGFNINIKPPTKKPYKVLGVIPQLNLDETHQTLRKSNRLITLEDYC